MALTKKEKDAFARVLVMANNDLTMGERPSQKGDKEALDIVGTILTRLMLKASVVSPLLPDQGRPVTVKRLARNQRSKNRGK